MNVLQKALAPPRKPIEEVKESIAAANSKYDQLLPKMTAYEEGRTSLVNENKSPKHWTPENYKPVKGFEGIL